MQTLKFNNGDELPAVGLGTWKSEPEEVYEAVIAAIEAGYRHIDCAPIYGNEAVVGRALQKVMADGLVKREDIWVTSKLWNNAHRREDVAPALKKTLKDLKLAYLDLYLIHWPVALKKGVEFPSSADDFLSLEEVSLTETWKGMEEGVKEGMARHIGVSNFNSEKILEVIESAEIKPEMNQVECHPYLQQKSLFDFCKKQGLHLTAYSPLGSRDRPERLRKEGDPDLFDNPVIKKIADKHACTPAQVLISWAVHRGTAVIPKSVTPSRIKENLASAKIALSSEEMKKIAELEKGYRFLDGGIWVMKGSPYKRTGLWEEVPV